MKNNKDKSDKHSHSTHEPQQDPQARKGNPPAEPAREAVMAPKGATPGYLISNVPGALGFFPLESLVVMGFEQNGSLLELGPVARLDLDNVKRQCDEAFSAVESYSDVIFAFVVSYRPLKELDWIADFLFEYSSATDRGFDACWHTPEISLGQPYELWFGPEYGDKEPMPRWAEGKIPTITDAASMTNWIGQGKLPEITRDDGIRQLNKRNPFITAANARAMTVQATKKSRAIVDAQIRLATGKATGLKPNSVVCVKAEQIRETALRLITECEGLDLDHVYAKQEALLELGSWLATATLRDVVLGVLIEHPATAEVLMLATMHTYSGTIRINALVIYAAVCIVQDMAMVGGLALSVATTEDPTHRLASLVNQAYRAGLHSRLVDNLTKGSELAVQNWKTHPRASARTRPSRGETAA
ncbi:hypothetical protein CPHO_05210 [Corynebacterium phocae]|uniref:DUF4192 domain-containing protein n=1 Tax=Corynebacterium phocae TaxID=161895 RepID=A0A1L7D384_9CORY|nr:DUF4192 domain-containing protein [Corynebacterium phocae]APT92392.1 hypothetical protein CPHO_05210 [Corynebacterium phocae]KAA8724985.1 DUF4192 domain-containing protein [Corynebacterium phocae]